MRDVKLNTVLIPVLLTAVEIEVALRAEKQMAGSWHSILVRTIVANGII